MKVIQNTYPKYPNVPHAEIGDIVHWEHRRSFCLVRDADNKIVFMTSLVTIDGNLRSTNLQPTLTGIIAKIKSKNFILEIQ
ncbi:unnamed protein product [marine sediment metagenome]|uniref:Uncharacterized protein n=1 Tax=marine sediment metagenome TaxID=412755 RepID=X0SFR9_9ZZZZ